jgi:hypothetical protein
MCNPFLHRPRSTGKWHLFKLWSKQIALPLLVPGTPPSKPCGILMVNDPCIFPDLPLPFVGLLYGPGLWGAAVVELDVDG